MKTLILLMAQVFGLAGSANEAPVSSAPTAGQAVLEGHFMYPACSAPADLRVCAEDRKTGEKHCGGPIAPGRDSYQLVVPAGQYEVFAESPKTRPGYRAFFNESVRCGLTVDCQDHKPVLVVAHAGARIENVNPADWFGHGLEVLR